MNFIDDFDKLVKTLDPEGRELNQRLRKVVKSAIPNVSESVKWGAPTFSVNGKIIANIMNYRDHVNLGFFKGAKLHSKLLEGTGKGLRHIKVFKPGDIKEKEIAKLLKEATGLEK